MSYPTGRYLTFCREGSAGNGIHFPALGFYHGGQKPLGAPQKLPGLVGSVQDPDLRDAAVFHGDLYPDGAAVAPGRADVNAVGIGQFGGSTSSSASEEAASTGCSTTAVSLSGTAARTGTVRGRAKSTAAAAATAGSSCTSPSSALHRFFVHSIFS